MKNKILFSIAILLFTAGIIFKIIHMAGGGTLIALGLILFIIWVTMLFGSRAKIRPGDIIWMIFTIAVTAWVFQVIQCREYLEILIAAISIGIISFLTTLIARIIKKKTH